MYVAIADDQESSLAGFSQILRRITDIEPICFKKAADALHWLGGVDPVFLVVNSTLADIPGIDLLRRVRLIAGRLNTPVIFTTGKPDRDLRRTAFELDVHAFLEKPINPSEFLVHAMHIIDVRRERADLQARLKQLSEQASSPVGTATALDTATLIRAMLDVAAMHDPTIVAHHQLSAQLAVALGRELKLTTEELETLAQAARIYDIGKVAIPQRILEASAPASQADRVSIERHADAGTRLLAGRDDAIMRAATIIAQTHHERYDGTGYPRKLRGSSIPMMGRIVAVSDTLSALLRSRGDRPAVKLAQAIAELERSSGAQYDPAVVAAVRANLNEISRIVHDVQEQNAQAS
jgi:response regulator RpfG family c-di-GMP phosphodiesterase